MVQGCKKKYFPVIMGVLISILTAMSVLLPGMAYAADKPISLVIDGKPVATDAAPITSNGRVLVPFRVIFETLGAKVAWDQKAQTAIGSKGQTCIVLKPDNKNAVIGTIKSGFSQEITPANLDQAFESSKTVVLDIAAMYVNSRLMVPVRFIAESLGADVKWDNKNQVVSITTASQFDKRIIGTWYTTESSLGMVIVKTFKSDGTFKQSLAIYSSISNYAEVTNGKFNMDGSNITYYGQTYAKAKGYWKSSARPGYETLGDIFLEGNLPADDKTESFSIEDDNHISLGGVEWTRYETSGASGGNAASPTAAALSYHSAKYGFTLTFPESWRGKYTVVEKDDSVQIFQKSTYDASKGEVGRLVSIAAFTASDWKKEGEGITSISQNYGSVENGNTVYYFGGPSDLQYDPSNKQAAKEFQDMEKDIPKIVKTFTPDKK